ncbi:zinc-binding metallopeptidase [Ornithobacterium rhinotracheale]|uniref:zinc-binding metallopeptidase n=1 Tax=Ornithobacterium rhinotracheale TaxID=28251 RepID=UPI001FF5A836|nr:putative zinc-binding metallopeptidase [Ornithobacterium rhinotracheale]MCK0204517.1 putative zinc-binding metallopeptidase [Ornithobacterium rhinotracheale]
MKKIISLAILSSLVSFSACDRDDELRKESVIPSISTKKTDLDVWIDKNFIDPYNIALLYKYEDTKTEQVTYVVPASYEKSIQMANIIKYLFLDPYKDHTPKNFLKKYGPKIIMLIGSGAYNPNGTVKLGLAENGVKFTLFDVNSLNVKNVEELYDRHFRTIYHEFSHILHQTKDYSPEFKRISAKDYVSDSWNTVWRNPRISNPENNRKPLSLEAGFISDYSSKDANEDFVELIAHYLTYSPENWKKTLDKAAGDKGDKPGKQILEHKISIVKNYMQKVWGINLDSLRDDIQARASKIGELEINKLK